MLEILNLSLTWQNNFWHGWSHILCILLLSLNMAFTEQVNNRNDRILVLEPDCHPQESSSEINRIRGYMYVCKKILAPLMLQPAPSLLRHCQHLRTIPTRRYRYEAKWPHRGRSCRVALFSMVWAYSRRVL